MGYQTPVSSQQSRMPGASPFQQQGHHGGHTAQPVERHQGYGLQQSGFAQQGQSRVDDERLAQDMSSMQLGNLPPDQAQVCKM